MKIIHELYNRCQVVGGALRPYAGPVAEQHKKPVSGYVDELLIVSPGDSSRDTDVIRIEGDLRVVVEALESALSCVTSTANFAVDKGELDPHWRKHAPHEAERRKG